MPFSSAFEPGVWVQSVGGGGGGGGTGGEGVLEEGEGRRMTARKKYEAVKNNETALTKRRR